MKHGDIVAFGKDNKVDLLCRVEGGNIYSVRMLVLNGSWRLEYSPLENLITYTPPSSGVVTINREIIYNDFIPGGDYNFQIGFIEELLKLPRPIRNAYTKYLKSKHKIISFKKRVVKSCKAFYNCWNDVDDSIAF